MSNIRLFAVLAVLVSFVAYGCSSMDEIPTAVPMPTTLVIQDMSFSPQAITVSKGVPLTVINSDPVQQNVTCGAVDTNAIEAGGTTTMVFKVAGVFECKNRINQSPGFQLTVTVK